MATFVNFVLGVTLLFTGRKLYWLFVGIIGFVIGFTLSGVVFSTESEWALLAIGLVAGAIGILLAIFFQRIAVGAAGFVAGGYVVMTLLQMMNWASASMLWLYFLVGGIIGLVLVGLLFDWALIILSSIMGAHMLVEVFGVENWLGLFVFTILTLVGLVVQSRSL